MVDKCEALPVTQRALLWCIRMWVLELRSGIEAQGQIDDMLETLGVSEMSPVLGEFIDALSQSCTRMIEIRCVCQPRLSADERTLMAVLSLAQALEFGRARALLGRFVAPAGTDTVLEKAEAIGTALVEAGHSLADIDAAPERRLVAHFDRLPPLHGTIH